MPDPTNQQDPWAVVSTTPVQQSAAPSDPWAVVNHKPAPQAAPGQPQTAGDLGMVTHRYDAASGKIVPVTQALPSLPNTSPVNMTGTSDYDAGQRAQQAVKNRVVGTGQAARALAAPPESAREMAIQATAGQSGLATYRAAASIVDAAEKHFKSPRERYQASKQDLLRAMDEFSQNDFRNAVASTGSLAADLSGMAYNPLADKAREITEGSRPGGDLVTPITNDAIDLGAAAAGEKLPELAVKVAPAVGDAATAVAEAPGKVATKIANTAEDIKPEWLTKREPTPLPQHGTPVVAEGTPLDGPTVGKQIGGKDLSQEALDTLQKHAGDTIPVGGTAKNSLMKAVEPVTKAINEAASKMNDIVADAPQFTTSTLTDSGLGEGKLLDDINKMKENLPASDAEKLAKDVDGVMKDADKALNSTDPNEVLEYRRQLGQKIDWDAIEKNPSTPTEVQNAARAKVYRAIGDKIHSEIPDTVALDKELQPHLELRSHMKSKLGPRVVDDPLAAKAESQSELKKGQTQVENATHNEQVKTNWMRVKGGLIALGVGGGIIHEIEKFLP